jgi:hypothetical protein
MHASTAGNTLFTRQETTDDGQLNLLTGGHVELPGSGQRDYLA